MRWVLLLTTIAATALLWSTGALAALVVGTDRGETLVGTDSADTIRAGGGDDILRGLGGPDKLYGQSGADQLYGGAGADRLRDGSVKTDLFYGGYGDDRIDAQNGIGSSEPPDIIYCGPGKDVASVDPGDRAHSDCEVIGGGQP
jgi:Ca2+-binding RTX toxin-like protein